MALGEMRGPQMRKCRCESCGHVGWVGGPLVPTRGIVCDVCRRDPCPECGGPMRPTHPELLADFENGVTNAIDAPNPNQKGEASR